MSKYKVGDKVRIKSLDWYNRNKDKNGYVDVGVLFDKEMSRWCGKTMTIIKVNQLYYTMEEDGISQFFWTDEMIEGLVEEETTSDKVIEEAKTYWDSIKDAWICPEGYQFKDENGNIINATKIVLEKKKKEYPKTYAECCKIIGIKLSDCYIQGYKSPLLEDLQQLLICRDAYWKIAGDEMGLRKPWEPDWDDDEWPDMYYISFDGKCLEKEKGYPCCNMILIFPTEEMRDAFYENFKELIEQCKELL